MSHGPSKTLSAENLFRFVCPIFGSVVEMRGCLQLRDLVYKGQAPAVRKGCQACLEGGKCPIPSVLREIDRETHSDPYHSTEPKVGHLSTRILKSIAPVVVTETTLRKFADMVPAQHAMIVESNGLNGALKLKGSDAETLEEISYRKPEYKASKKPAEKPAAPIVETPSAAASGDMTAALNAAMKEGIAA